MSVAAVDHPVETSAPTRTRETVDVNAWLAHGASLRRTFTTVYVPRHRADVPAV